MTHRVADNQKCWRGGGGDVHHCQRDQGRRALSCFRRRKLIIVQNRVLAALIRVRRRDALAFKATIRGLATWGAGRETIKGPE